MKKQILILFTVLLTMSTLTSCSSDSESIDTPSINEAAQKAYAHNTTELELLDIVNEYRVSKGLNALQIIEHISYESNEHNQYMIATNSVNHDGFDQRKSNLQQVLGAVRVGENVAYGYSSPESTLNAWVNSDGHRANLEGEYTHFGVSIREDEEGRKYYTNMFIKK